MRKKKTSKKRLKAPKFSTPPEKELSKLCESMLHINDTKGMKQIKLFAIQFYHLQLHFDGILVLDFLVINFG